MELGLLDGCDVCGGNHETEDCPELIMEEENESSTTLLSRARLTLPHFVELAEDESGRSLLLAKETLPAKMKLGPMEARKTTQDIDLHNVFTLKLLLKDGSSVNLDTSDENQCNWLCLVPTALDATEQNLMAVQMGVEIYYMTMRAVQQGEALSVWYAPHYAKKLGKSSHPDGSTMIMLGQTVSSHMEVVLLVQDPEQAQQEAMVQKLVTSSGSPHKAITTLSLSASPYKALPAPEECDATEGTADKGLRCKKCDFTATTTLMLHMHELVHSPAKHSTSQDDSDAIWDLPSATTDTIQALANPRLTKRVYDEQKQDQMCQKCNKSFSDVRELAIHIRAHIQRDQPAKRKRPRGRPRKHKNLNEEEWEPVAKSSQSTAKKAEDIIEQTSDKETELSVEIQEEKMDYELVGKVMERIPHIPKKTIIRTRRQAVREKQLKGEASGPIEISPAKKANKQTSKMTVKKRSERILKNEASNEDIVEGKEREAKDTPVKSKAVRLPELSGMKTRKRANAKSCVIDNTNDAENMVGRVSNDGEKDTCGKVGGDGEVCGDGEKGTYDKAGGYYQGVVTDNGACEGGEAVSDNNMVQEEIIGPYDDVTVQESVDVDIHDAVDAVEVSTGDGIDIVYVEGEENKAQEMAGMVAIIDTNQEIVQEGDTGDENQIEVVIKTASENRESTKENDSPNRHEETEELRDKMRQIMNNCNMEVSDDNVVKYKCKVCEKVFDKLEKFGVHLNIHLGIYKCDICDHSFATKRDLQKHQCKEKVEIKKEIDEETDKIYSCVYCGKSFMKQLYLQRHMQGHTDIFKCPDCQKRFARKESLINHSCPAKSIKTENEDAAHYVYCEFCGQQFKNRKYLLRHMAAHTGEFKCANCQREFARKESLLMHMRKCDPQFSPDDKKGFPCPKCNRVFTKELSLINHMSLHNEVHKCPVCRKCFASRFSMDRHICGAEAVDENGTFVYKCQECDKSFFKEKHLQMHMAIHTEEFKCVICSQVFTRREDLVRHTLECTAHIQAETTGEIKCTVCQEIFNDPPSFRFHYREHTHPYQCEKCEKRFIRKVNLDAHRCDTWDGEPVPCEVCKKKFRHPKYLQRHMIVHGEPKYPCETCDKKFMRIDLYNNHECINSDGVKVPVKPSTREDFTKREKSQVVCPTCGKSYVSMSNLNKHMLTHGDKNETCVICKKKFHLKVALREHMKSVHTDRLQHQCQYCGKFMKSRNSIFGHIRQFHSETLIMYQCEDCGKSFRQKGNLKKHILTHTDEKLFQCNECDRRFKYPEQLRRHELWHKEGSKYQCEFCNRRFVMQHELRKHMKILHSGQVYICEFCYTECRHAHTMKRHLSRRHADQVKWQVNTAEYIQGLVRERPDEQNIPTPLTTISSSPFTSNPIEIAPNLRMMTKHAGETSRTASQLDSVLPQTMEQPLIVAEVSGIGDSGETETTQTVIIQTGTNQFQMNGQMIPQELANALHALTNRGALDEQSTISIIGDLPGDDSGEQPIVYGQAMEDDQGGFIVVPMTQEDQDAAAVAMETGETGITLHASQEGAVGGEVNIVEAALSQAMHSGDFSVQEVSSVDNGIIEVPLPDGNTVTVPVSGGQTINVPISDKQTITVPLSGGQTIMMPLSGGQSITVPISPVSGEDTIMVPMTEGDDITVPISEHQDISVSETNIETDFIAADMVEIPISHAGMAGGIASVTEAIVVQDDETTPDVTTVFSS